MSLNQADFENFDRNQETRIDLEGAKYTIVHRNGVGLRALRYGEPWRDLVGDGLVLAMAQEIESLRKEVEALQMEIRCIGEGE